MPVPELYQAIQDKHDINKYYRDNNTLTKWVTNYKLYRELNDIETEIATMTATTRPHTGADNIKSVKNQYKSHILNVHKIQTTDPSDSFYLVFANNGCLSVGQNNNNNNNNTTTLTSTSCDGNVYTQIFKISTAEDPLIINSSYQIRTKTDSNLCLQFAQSGLSVQPCEPAILGQNFKPMYTHVDIRKTHA